MLFHAINTNQEWIRINFHFIPLYNKLVALCINDIIDMKLKSYLLLNMF